MKSRLSTAQSDPGGLVDQLVDLQPKGPVRIDRRLLDEQFWSNRPELVNRLLTEMACGAAGPGLARLARCYQATTKKPFEPRRFPPHDIDYFLVLGKVLNKDATPKPELTARLEGALWACEKRPEARLLVSGGAPVGGINESAMMKRWLVDRGIAARRILRESRSIDTVENIRMSTALLVSRQVKHVCLITGAQAARREALLLMCHLQHIGSPMIATHIAPAVASACQGSNDALPLESFLLFKDLGRTFGLWKYRNRFPHAE